MRVLVKHRLRGDGRIWIDYAKTKVLQDTGGWYAVQSPSGLEDARVLYRPVQDMVVIEQLGQFLRVPFHDGEGTFSWQGRTYRVGSMALGEVRIHEGARPVATGLVTTSGLQLETVEPELLGIVRALAWGLALRSEEIARDSRRVQP